MKSTRHLVWTTMTALFFLALLSFGWAQSTTRELHVKLTYTGPGEVSATNPIHVYLFDTPEIGPSSMPIGMDSARENGGVVKFAGLYQSKVYMVAAYGNYDLYSGPPPTGTPVAMYKPGEMGPTPIPMEQAKVEVEFRFDDSFRMP